MSSETTKTKDKTPAYSSGLAHDGWSSGDEATATCFCGAVQLVVPLKSPGLMTTFACHCLDCRRISASMFATNFMVRQSHTRFIRGRDQLAEWGQGETTFSGKTMTHGFCRDCGTLMYRAGAAFPGTYFLLVGTVDDAALHQTVLRPRVEQFVRNRVEWLAEIPGTIQLESRMTGKEEGAMVR